MSTQTVEFRAATGLTITAKLFAAGSDTQVASVTATEATNRKGTYLAVYTNVAAGEYQLIAFDSQPIPVASWWVTLTLSTATFGVYDKADTRDINTRSVDIQSRLPAALVSGRIDSSVGAMASNVITAASMASDASGEIADAVWDEPYAGHTTAGSFGKLMDLLRKANMVVEGTVLASPTPTTTTFNVSGLNYPTGAFEHAVLFFADDSTLAEQNSPILTFTNNGNGTQTIVLEEARTAAPVAGDTVLIDATSHVHAIADIQAGLATTTQLTTVEGKIDTLDDFVDTEVAAMKAVLDKLDTTVVLDGAVYQFTANALELGPSGNASVIVSPLSSLTPEAVIGTRIPKAVGDVKPVTIDVYDASGVAVNLSTQGNLEVCVETEANVDLQVVAHASITISGTSSNKATWTPNAASVATVAKHRWSLRIASNKSVLAYGVWDVLRVALADA